MNKKEMKVWRRLLGKPVKSFTNPDKTYTVFFDGEKYTCDCPDYIFRRGSYILYWEEKGENGEVINKSQRGCKHIAKYLGETFGKCKALDKHGWMKVYP